jgi:hypothetical protein
LAEEMIGGRREEGVDGRAELVTKWQSPYRADGHPVDMARVAID